VSCPDWPELLALRQRLGAGQPPEWERATAHLDGCPACRRVAERLDPALLFRRLPVVSSDEAAIDDMRRRVELLRRARQVEKGLGRHRRWRESAAAALLALGLLGVLHGSTPQREAARASRASLGEPPFAGMMGELTGLPVLEHLDQPFDQIVQWSSDELSMILLLDERFDV
jgi:hypothetical protein